MRDAPLTRVARWPFRKDMGIVSAEARRKCILLVEDDESVRALVKHTLGSAYDVFEAADGRAAQAMLAKIAMPDLMITDVAMPHFDGLELAAWMKLGALWRVPILFLSARGALTDIVAGINAGARHYLTKPFKPKELRARVDRLMARAV